MTPLPTTDVLIIDDDAAIRGLVGAALTRLAVSWHAAVDGADALDQIERTRYSVVLVDLMMPRIDGEAFVTALREHERVSRERPVVLIMTAFPVRDRLTSLGESVQAVLQKPFDVVELAEIVRACVAGRRALEEEAVVPAERPSAPTVGEPDPARNLPRPRQR